MRVIDKNDKSGLITIIGMASSASCHRLRVIMEMPRNRSPKPSTMSPLFRMMGFLK